jgi:hypothetical protein
MKTGMKQAGFGYFIIRSEWDDRCVAYVNNQLVLVSNCQMGQAVWEGKHGQTQNIAIKNYFTGKYLGFQPGVRTPLMLDNPNNNFSKWNFQSIHGHNRRWPANRSYWHITYHIIRNIGTGLCLMVSGDTVGQLNCNPGKPEHLSFEEVKFNNAWQKSPERIAEEKQKEIFIRPVISPGPRPVIAPAPIQEIFIRPVISPGPRPVIAPAPIPEFFIKPLISPPPPQRVIHISSEIASGPKPPLVGPNGIFKARRPCKSAQ